MPVSILTPDKILRRTHKKQVVSEQNLNNFKTNLTNLLEKLKDEVNNMPSLKKKILTLKEADQAAAPSKFEDEIDRMVYKLNELKENEIRIIEGDI